MNGKISDILSEAVSAISRADSGDEVENLRVNYLGKKGKLTEFLKSLGELPPAERPKVGQQVNEAKQEIHTRLAERLIFFKQKELEAQLAQETIDVALAGRRSQLGSLHPVMQVKDRIESLFLEMGFDIASGLEIEDEFHNFEALNIPAHHPARAEHDTFYFDNKMLLRTHTSPVQIHYMKDRTLPIRMIAPGRVYRCDFDATHTPMFHQVEGLMVDEHITFAQLKGLLTEFLCRFFDKDIPVRFRPSYFPFTEPSAELDIQFGKKGEWLEVLGCGMVHPNVFRAVGIDAEKYQGYAFGLGIDRLAMLYYGINDLRLLFENNLNFLKQF